MIRGMCGGNKKGDIQRKELVKKESAKTVFEHRLSENTLDSANVKGKL